MSATTPRPGVLTLDLALTLPLGARAAEPRTPSLIEVPIRIDLTLLFRAADARLPREAGHWQGWEDWHGIKTRYRAWGGPLTLSLSGDLLQAVGVFYERIRDALDKAANDLLCERTGDVRVALQAALGRVLARAELTGVGLDLSGVTLRDQCLEIGTAGLRLTGSAGGQVKVQAGPL